MTEQTDLVEPLTFTVLEVAGDGEKAAFLMRLLEGEATTRQLRSVSSESPGANKHLRTELSQPTASRHLTRLTDVGLAGPGRKAKTYRLVHPGETRRFVAAVNGLAIAIDHARTAADEALRQDLEGE